MEKFSCGWLTFAECLRFVVWLSHWSSFYSHLLSDYHLVMCFFHFRSPICAKCLRIYLNAPASISLKCRDLSQNVTLLQSRNSSTTKNLSAAHRYMPSPWRGRLSVPYRRQLWFRLTRCAEGMVHLLILWKPELTHRIPCPVFESSDFSLSINSIP